MRNPVSGIVALLGALALLLVGGVADGRAADPRAESMQISATADRDGALSVRTVITGSKLAKARQVLNKRAPASDDSEYEFTISDVKVSADADVAATVTDKDRTVEISFDAAKASGKPITISYRVVGAVHPVAGSNKNSELVWPVYQGFDFGVEKITGELSVPGQLLNFTCQAGAANLLQSCEQWQSGTFESPTPTFSDGPRNPGELVLLTTAQPTTTIAPDENLHHHWSLDRAFSLNWISGLGSLAILLLGALGLLLWRRRHRGTAAGGEPVRIGEFTPVGPGVSAFTLVTPVRPGQVGTVADETVDPIDVTGTLLDLAVRGYVRITQLPQEPNMPMEWAFTRTNEGRGELRRYESLLLDAIAPVGGEPVYASQITSAVGPVIDDVQDALYDDVVAEGWFARRPDASRSDVRLIGALGLLIGLVITTVLAIFTNLALLGIAVIVLAIALLFVVPEPQHRTAKGADLLAGLTGFSAVLQQQNTTHLDPARALHEISQVLPYAVVLGGKDRWIDALVAADPDGNPDAETLDWYHAPNDWHLDQLPASLDAFIAVIQGHLFDR